MRHASRQQNISTKLLHKIENMIYRGKKDACSNLDFFFKWKLCVKTILSIAYIDFWKKKKNEICSQLKGLLCNKDDTFFLNISSPCVFYCNNTWYPSNKNKFYDFLKLLALESQSSTSFYKWNPKFQCQN